MKEHEIIRQCCQCGHIAVGARWLDACSLSGSPVSHTYCPDCLKIAQDALTRQIVAGTLGQLRGV